MTDRSDADRSASAGLVPGQVVVGARPVALFGGRPVTTLTVRNAGDRPVQVGSHFHLAEANAALELDRAAAWGHRLAVPAGTAVRFEPGVEIEVPLVPLAGRRRVPGLNRAADGDLDDPDHLGATGDPGVREGDGGTPAGSHG